MSYVNKVDGYFIRLSNGDYLSVFDLDIVKEKTMEVTKLKELRNNTWDTNRVDTAIKFLTENFEVKDDPEHNTK